ncbi:hypothetical protein QQS21_012544 [Conoideocrella luteorostrata]|uniref:Nudix hydrolase domain-containing protein n=1 Tax=Conoideocrella luteorostrata TaxID=1105319 RepID=A0AAJ0CDB1_9HYPO|nr:hypothetical protein QQS21_012544 [Conoideocrella luteorostrata]
MPDIMDNLTAIATEVEPLLSYTISQFHDATNERPFDKLVAGAAVFRPSPQSTTPEPQILLLQRSKDEAYYPSVYELPSGKVGIADATVCSALFRELKEESGLVGHSVLGRVKDLEYETVKTVKGVGDNGEEAADLKIVRRAVQVNFIVRAQSHDQEIAVNPKEHQNGGWFARAELAGLDITEGMRGIIDEAFQWAQENSALIV